MTVNKDFIETADKDISYLNWFDDNASERDFTYQEIKEYVAAQKRLMKSTPQLISRLKQFEAAAIARPIEEWGEDYGDVLWWKFPIEEPPYCGSPLCTDWPDYHTHWTPIITPDHPKELCPGCGWHMVPQTSGDESPDWEECQNPDCDYDDGNS